MAKLVKDFNEGERIQTKISYIVSGSLVVNSSS